MEPIKEKIYQLKKLASEKKLQNQQQQNQLIQLENTTNEIHLDKDDTNTKNASILNHIEESEKLQEYQSTNNSLAIDESETSLLVYDDKPDFREENLNKETIDTTKNTNSLYETISEMSSKLETDNKPMSKYVNRIKDFYDKERASSTESLGGKSVFSNKVVAKAKAVPKEALSQPQLKAPIALPEATIESPCVDESKRNDSDFDESSSISIKTNRTNKYINNLLNNFNATSTRSDSIENSKRNNFNSSQSQTDDANKSNSQVDKLKEKFIKISHEPDRPNNATANRNLTLIESLTQSNSVKTPLLANEHSNELELRFKSTNQNEAEFNTTRKNENSSRNLKKYQRSKTSDLSDVIFVKNESGNLESDKFSRENQFDSLFSKYGVDKKYQTENAIIKSTMFLDKIRTSNYYFLFKKKIQ